MNERRRNRKWQTKKYDITTYFEFYYKKKEFLLMKKGIILMKMF